MIKKKKKWEEKLLLLIHEHFGNLQVRRRMSDEQVQIKAKARE